MESGRKQFSQSFRDSQNSSTRSILLDNNSTNSEKKKSHLSGSSVNSSKASKRNRIDVKSTSKNRTSDSVSSSSYSRNYYSTSSGSTFDSLHSSDDGDLPTVRFDTNNFENDSSSYFSFSDQRSRQNSHGYSRGSSEEHSSGESDVKIPIFRFSSKTKDSKKRTKTIQPELEYEPEHEHEHSYDKWSQGSYHTKAPPIKEIDPTTTTTTTQTGQFNTPAPFFIPMLDTPSDIKEFRDDFSSKTAKKSKERKPPPDLLDERKSYGHVPKYEAPLQKAVEAYRKAALEEKEQQKRREEERKKAQKLLREQQEATANDVKVALLTPIDIPEDKELSSPLPKAKAVKKKRRLTTDDVVENSIIKSKREEPRSVEVKVSKGKKNKKKKGKKKKAKNLTQAVVSSEDTSYEEESPQPVSKPSKEQTADQNKVPDSLQENYDINDDFNERLPPVNTPTTTLSSMSTDPDRISKIKLTKTSNDALKKIMNSEPDDIDTDDSFFKEDKSVKVERPISDDDIESIHEDEIDDGYGEYGLDDDSGSPFKFQRPKFIAEGGLDRLELSTSDSGAQINTYSFQPQSTTSPETNKVNIDSADIASMTPPELESNAVSDNATDSILNSRLSSNVYDSRKALPPTGDFEPVEDIELESLPKDSLSYSSTSSKSTKSKKSRSVKDSDALDSLSSNSIPAPRTFKKRGKLPILDDVDDTRGEPEIESFTSDFLKAIPKKIVKEKSSRSAETTRTGLPTQNDKGHRNNTVDIVEPIYKPRPRKHARDGNSVISEPIKSDLDLDELMKAYNETKANNFARLSIEPEAKKKESVREYAKQKSASALPPVPPANETDSGSVALESIYHDDSISIHTDTSYISDVASLSSRTNPQQDGSESGKKRSKRTKKDKKNDDSSVVSEQPTLPEELSTVVPSTQIGEERHNAFRWETYRNTQPTVSKSELLMGKDEERFVVPIENPTEPIKGWIKFQVGLIPEADTADIEQKASEKFDFEVLLKRMRSN